MNLAELFQQEIRKRLNQQGDLDQLNTEILMLALQYRLQILERSFFGKQLTEHSATVLSGPFTGLKMPLPVHAGITMPIIFGSYENELHPYIEKAIGRGYETVINIGCGDGYYACGLAMRMPKTKVIACDINPEAQAGCRTCAANNDVADRVTIMGEFKGEDFAKYPAKQTLVVCDIEGGEKVLLDPEKYPALKQFDMIVELHEVVLPGIAEKLKQRFSQTHNYTFVPHSKKTLSLAGAPVLSEFDEFLLTFEGRGGPTPWGVFTVK